MDKIDTILWQQELAPFQARFIDLFLASDSDLRLCQMAWPVGTGKTRTTAHLIQRLLLQRPDARILLIFEIDFLQQAFVDTLNAMGVNTSVIDRYAYREMENSAIAGKPMWPDDTVYLMEKRIITQEDVVDSLCSVNWTLLVLTSTDRLLVPQSLLERLASSSLDLRVLAFSDFPGKEVPPPISGRAWSTAEFSWSELNGGSSDTGERYNPSGVQVIGTHCTPAEARLNASVARLLNVVSRYPLRSASAADLALRFQSSPIALEEAVRAIRSRLLHGSPSWLGMNADDELVTMALAQPDKTSQLMNALTTYLDAIDGLSIDSKLNAFKSQVQKQMGGAAAVKHGCVYSAYSSTLFYLQAALQDTDVSAYLLLDDTSQDSRNLIQGFKTHGGVLLGSSSLLSNGVDFSFVESLILYDAPATETLLRHLYGRFVRGRRDQPLSITVFDHPVSDKFKNLDVAQTVNAMANMAD